MQMYVALSDGETKITKCQSEWYISCTEQVRSRSELGLVRKMRIIRIKRKDNCYFSYEKKFYRGSGKGMYRSELNNTVSFNGL